MSLPYFPMFPADFEADTSHLTLEEDGAYNRLLRLCWMTPGCSVPDDAAWIARRMRLDAATFARVVAPLLDEFFKRRNGRVYSPRLMAIFEETDAKHKRRVEAGKKGGRPRKALESNASDQSNAKAMPKQPEPEPEPKVTVETDVSTDASPKPKAAKPKPVRSDEFWDAYPRRNGKRAGKAEAMAEYARLVSQGIPEERLIVAARAYADECSRTDTFACDAVRWLKKRRWEDETADIIPLHPHPTQQRTKGHDKLAAFLDGARNPRGPGVAGGSGLHSPGVLLPRR